jgi:hypothetical protein
MSKQNKPIGALSPGYWETLSEEEREIAFYRSNPKAAFLRIRQLEESNRAITDSAAAALATATAIIGASQQKNKRRLEAHAKRLSKLNQKEATAKNKLKGDNFKHDLKQFVNGRIKNCPAATPKEIVADVLASSWVRRKKDGSPYAEDYLYPMVSKLVTAAKAALKRGAL